MPDYEKLIAEAVPYVNDNGIMGMPGSPNAVFCDLITRLAAALRELAPPDGWHCSEFARRDQEYNLIAWVQIDPRRGDNWNLWRRVKSGSRPWAMKRKNYPTAAAAMAALDKERETSE